jgi:hypothetical protein
MNDYCPLDCQHRLNNKEFCLLALESGDKLIRHLLKCKDHPDCKLDKSIKPLTSK